MNEFLAYWNGRYLPAAQVHIPLDDAGFRYGATVSDLCRTFRHRLFRLEDHLERFERSCRAVRVPLQFSQKEIREVAEKLIESNTALIDAKDDLFLSLLATPGVKEPTLILRAYPIPFAWYAGFIRDGVRLRVPSVRSPDPSAVPPSIKHRSRLHWWLAEQEVKQVDPDAIALLLDQECYVTETATANFLIVKDGRVLTPACRRVLDGISLRVTAELCVELGIPFKEVDLRQADCASANAALVTSTPFGIAEVRRFNEVDFGSSEITARLQAKWNELACLDIGAQILVRAKVAAR